MHPKDAEGIANSTDPDQTAPMIWVCTVCPDLSVQKLRKITVFTVPFLNIHLFCLSDILGYNAISGEEVCLSTTSCLLKSIQNPHILINDISFHHSDHCLDTSFEYKDNIIFEKLVLKC